MLRQCFFAADNIDLWVGGLVEDVVDGAKVGPTFQCVIAEQFARTRAGDRFWYENDGVFTPAQLREIQQANLARVICDNADDITEVPSDVFRKHTYPQGYVQCSDDVIPHVDLKLWASCCSGLWFLFLALYFVFITSEPRDRPTCVRVYVAHVCT